MVFYLNTDMVQELVQICFHILIVLEYIRCLLSTFALKSPTIFKNELFILRYF